MHLRKGFTALLIVGSMFLAACGGSTPAGETQQPSSSGPGAQPGTSQPASGPAGPKVGGTIRAAYSTEPSSLTPWRSGDTNTHFIYYAMYETLVDQTKEMEIVPMLAESWTTSDDGLVWTFKLRQDVKFHDGTPFDAEAVKFNVELWTTNAPQGAINTTSDITDVKVLDSHTVQLTINAPNNQLLITLANRGRAILSPTAVKEKGEDFGRQPSGTGPFKFSNWVTDSTITLVKNENYWQKDANGNALPYLEKLEFKLIPDASVRRTALLTGEIDLDFSVAPESVSELTGASQYEIFNQPGMGYISLRLLTTQPPFDKKEVRQALAWATDRDALNKAIYFGFAFPGYTMYSPPTPGFRDIKPNGPRDIAKGKDLLTRAGYPDGFEMDMIVASPLHQTMAEVLQAQYKEIGVKVNIKNLERGTFLDGIVKRDHMSYIDSLTGRSDPWNYYSHLECDATYNGHDYCNPEVDRLARDGIEKFNTLTDPQRLAVYQKAEDIVLDEMPMVMLLHPPILMAWNKSFDGIVVTPPGRVFWTHAHKN